MAISAFAPADVGGSCTSRIRPGRSERAGRTIVDTVRTPGVCRAHSVDADRRVEGRGLLLRTPLKAAADAHLGVTGSAGRRAEERSGRRRPKAQTGSMSVARLARLQAGGGVPGQGRERELVFRA